MISSNLIYDTFGQPKERQKQQLNFCLYIIRQVKQKSYQPPMNFIDQITTYIIRPSREQYHINRLGPKQLYIPIIQPPPSSSSGPSSTYPYISIFRDDYIIASHPHPQFPSRLLHYSYYTNHMSSDPLLCVVYLHANNGSRVQGLPYLQQLFKNGYNVCLIDFIGSGCSEGEYITLGLDQCQDLHVVVQDINRKKGVKKVVLWGRSMGACTGIIYAAKYGYNGSVVGMVLDSPFMDLRLLVKETASQKTGLPQIFFQPILGFVNSELKQKIGHEFSQYNIIQYMSAPEKYQGEPAIPILFLTSRQDKLVKSHHIQQLYNKYYGRQNIEKFIYYINNQHHEDRDYRTIGKCIGFIRYAVNSNHGKQINQNVYNKRNSMEIPRQNLISASSNHPNGIGHNLQHNEDKKQPTSESTRYQPLATSDRGLAMQSENLNDQKVSFSFRTQWLIKSSNNIPAPPLPTPPSSHQIGYHGGIQLDSSYAVERMQQAKKDNFCLYKGKSIQKGDNRSNNSNIHSRVALNHANQNHNADYTPKANINQNSEIKQRRGIKLVEKEKYKLSKKRKGQQNSYLSQHSQGQSLISNISSINLYHNLNFTNPHIRNSNFSQIPINKQTNTISHNYNPHILDTFPSVNIGVNEPLRLSPKFKQSRINLSKIGSQNHSMQMHESYNYPNTNNNNNNTHTIANDRTRTMSNNKANNGYGDIRYNSGEKYVNNRGLDSVKLIESYKYEECQNNGEGYSSAGININGMMKGITNQVGIQQLNTKKVNLRQYSNEGRVQETGYIVYSSNGEKSPISKIGNNGNSNRQNGQNGQHCSLTGSVQKLYEPRSMMKYSCQQQQQQIQNIHNLKPQINRYSVQKLRSGAMGPNQQQQQQHGATQFKYQHQSANHQIQNPNNFNTHNSATNKPIPEHPSSTNKSPQSHSHAPQKQTTKISLSKISLAQPNNNHHYYPPPTTTQPPHKYTVLGYLPMTGPIVPNTHAHTHTHASISGNGNGNGNGNGKMDNRQLYQYASVSKMGGDTAANMQKLYV